ncbi:hypothetical protein NM688_g1728 [Phlebia brevispora]|uniref:Uncharacterized protein n=1 Tax=Phlebia brevispora TaxID=194682 RepID=A0ACC1TAI3_9APHY|nr:hypothetical protein NM688_g1728 [Phlebia brevispora]
MPVERHDESSSLTNATADAASAGLGHFDASIMCCDEHAENGADGKHGPHQYLDFEMIKFSSPSATIASGAVKLVKALCFIAKTYATTSCLKGRPWRRGCVDMDRSSSVSLYVVMLPVSYQLLAVAALSAFVWFYVRKYGNKLPLPPGPRALPIIGNLLDMPRNCPWLTYSRWAQQYDSDVLYLYLPFRPIIILDSVKAAYALLEKRSSIYSDKPVNVMSQIVGWDWNMALIPYGRRWRGIRRVFHQQFNAGAVREYRDIQAREIAAFLRRELDADKLTIGSVHQLFAAIILDVVYAIRIESMDDPRLKVFIDALVSFDEINVPGAFWVESFPFLKYVPAWVPGMTFHRYGKIHRPKVAAVRDNPYAVVQEDVAQGDDRKSVAHRLVRQVQEVYGNSTSYDEEESYVKDAVSVAYAGGVETSYSTTSWFILTMAMYPHVQEKAQHELDRIIGQDRLPTHEDFPSLPYLRAVYLEALRWQPTVPLGIPHRSMADDEYSGYHIPKGSMVVKMAHNPDDYPNPDDFDPDRFMKDGELNHEVLDPTTFVFGFGRRSCAGQHFARESLLLAFASILNVFTIEPALDKDDKPLKLTTDAPGGALFPPYELLAVTAVFAFAWLYIKWSRSRLALPPGPKPLPIVGNLFDMPRVRPWLTYSRWAQQYDSDILYLQLPSSSVIILDSLKTTYALLEKRSTVYADKPLTVMDEVVGWDWNMALMPYGRRWRSIRRVFHQHFNARAVFKYREAQEREIAAFLRRELDAEKVTVRSVHQLFAATILDIVYGIQIKSMDDSRLGTFIDAIVSFNEINVPGAFWVDSFPFLRHIPAWVPGTAFHQYGKIHRPKVTAMREDTFAAVQKDIAEKSTKQSIAHQLVRQIRDLYGDGDMYVEEAAHAKDAVSVAYSAGVETSYSTASWFVLAMAMHPHVQAKAQHELDRVIGKDRLPTHEDIPSLPYLQAVFLETLRWQPAVPMGIPHRSMADDEYKGYHIPKGTIVIYSYHRKMAHNPDVYPNPDEFNPGRFMKDGQLDHEVLDPTTFVFGFGRRNCAGRHFVQEVLRLAFASILSVYNVEAILDKDGKPVKLTTDAPGGVLFRPERLDCVLKPRSDEAVQLIRRYAQ